MQTYSTVRSIDSRSYVQPKIVSTKLFSTKCCVSYMLSLLGRSALERHFLGVASMDFYRNTAYKVWHDLWRLRLKHSLSASNFKAKIALVYKWKALSCTYVKKCSDWITYSTDIIHLPFGMYWDLTVNETWMAWSRPATASLLSIISVHSMEW